MYNGEDYLEEALDSIAAQTLTDYEVIISDNASTDATPRICEARAAADPRIRYFRNATNIGGDRNYYRCFELSRGKYFLGVAHDDRLHPGLPREGHPGPGSRPAVAFCHSRAYRIDGSGEVVGTYDAKPFSTSSRPEERFRDAIGLRAVIAHLGVLRSSVIRQMPPLLAYPSSDAYWQAELALRGKLVEIPELLFYRRVQPNSGGAIPMHERIRWSDPSKAALDHLPVLAPPDRVRAVGAPSPLTLRERAVCFQEIGRYLRRRGGSKALLRDFRVALRTVLDRLPVGHRFLESRQRRRKP